NTGPGAVVTLIANGFGTTQLMTDGNSVFGVESRVTSVPVGGGPVTELTSITVGGTAMAPVGYFMAADAQHFYTWFTDGASFHLIQLAKPSLTAPTEIWSGASQPVTSALAVSAKYVYFAHATTGVARVSIAQRGAATQLATDVSGSVQAMTLFGGAL